MSQANPFIRPDKDYGAVSADDRLRALESFNLEQCRAALSVPGLQKTVEKKLRSRIRMLEKRAIATTQNQTMSDQKACTLCGAGLTVLAEPSPAPELKCPAVVGYACLDDIQWGGDITLRPEQSEHYSIPFAPVAQAGQVLTPCKHVFSDEPAQGD